MNTYYIAAGRISNEIMAENIKDAIDFFIEENCRFDYSDITDAKLIRS